MNKFVIFSILIGVSVGGPLQQQLPRDDGAEVDELALEQNKNAKYQFESDIVDHINDLTSKRVEERDGLNVKGVYEYSDGYVRRTVHYIADENGFRIVKEENEPLPGPKVNLNGEATIYNKAHGTELKYSVKSVPITEGRIFE